VLAVGLACVGRASAVACGTGREGACTVSTRSRARGHCAGAVEPLLHAIELSAVVDLSLWVRTAGVSVRGASSGVAGAPLLPTCEHSCGEVLHLVTTWARRGGGGAGDG